MTYLLGANFTACEDMDERTQFIFLRKSILPWAWRSANMPTITFSEYMAFGIIIVIIQLKQNEIGNKCKKYGYPIGNEFY